MTSWYYDDGQGSAVGPFDDDQLRALITEGRVPLTTFVLRAGTTNWVPLSSVALEIGLPSAPPPPPPAPTGTGFAAPAPGSYSAPPPAGFQVSYVPPPGGSTSPNGRSLARWGRRVGAAILDSLVVGIPVNIVLGVAHLTVFKLERIKYTGGRKDSYHFHFGTGGFVISLAAFVAYAGLLNGLTGQTIGKRVAHTRVVDMETGRLIGGPRGVGRALVQYIFGWLCVLGILDGLFPIWDRRRQSLHDKVVHTVVELVD